MFNQLKLTSALYMYLVEGSKIFCLASYFLQGFVLFFKLFHLFIKLIKTNTIQVF